MRYLFTLCLLFIAFQNFAAVGDTTVILSHTNTNLKSPPTNDDIWVSLPNNKTWSKIIMRFTLGCGTPNCSGWDYTVTTSLGKKNGIDSSVAAIDTLTLDTTWSYFPKLKFTQVGKLITPYGTYMANNSNGYNQQWKHPYYYDLTDYAALLQDSVNVRIRYDGWTDAFSAKIEFILIEGSPNKQVVQVDELYNQYINYPNSAAFENVAVAKRIVIPANVTSAKVNLIMTGHGSQGEFDPRNVYLDVNSAQIFSRLLWKADCGMTSIAPQGGTWIFNRANWCPGEKIQVFEIDVTSFIVKGQQNTFDLNMEDFAISSGQEAGYGIGAYLVCYSTQSRNDVALEAIVSPSSDPNMARFNPICGQAEVVIKNEGSLPLTICDIAYWVEGGAKCYYQWRGSLNTYATANVKLPAFDWNGMDTANKRFFAEVSWPNGKVDEFVQNNLAYSNFNFVPRLDSLVVLQLRTNNHPEETSYLLRDENGDTVVFKNSFLATKTYLDTFNLATGCYQLDIYDYDQGWEGGDGLSWWLNTQQGYETSGSVLMKKLTGQTIKTFNPDFGSNLHYEFTVGYPQGFNPPRAACTPFVHNVGIEEGINTAPTFNLYPNPTQGNVTISSIDFEGNVQVVVADMTGRTVATKSFDISPNVRGTIEFNPTMGNGVFTVNVRGKSFRNVERVIYIQ